MRRNAIASVSVAALLLSMALHSTSSSAAEFDRGVAFDGGAAFGGIEELLNAEPPADSNESPLSALLNSESMPSSSPASAVPTLGSSWRHPMYADGAILGEQQTPGVEHSDDVKTEPSPAVNFVPEPSAILLAGAALIYFLLFGRRRRLA
jgi:hypothetical protein